MNRFRLHKLTILNHKILGYLELNFCPKDDDIFDLDNNNIYTTVIIGANGVGKSILLSALTKIFIYIDSIKRNEEIVEPLEFSFEMKYSIGRDNLFIISNFKDTNDLRIKKNLYSSLNGISCVLAGMELPSKVLASTMTITDKFVAKSQGIYKYRGIRNENDPIRTGTKTLTRKIVSYLIESFRYHNNKKTKENLKDLLNSIGFTPRISLSYTLRYRDIFCDGKMSPQKLCAIYDNQKDIFIKRKDEIWGSSNFKKMRGNEIYLRIISKFLNDNALAFNERKELVYEILDDTDKFINDSIAIELLTKLDLLSYPSLNFYKNESFHFEDASSGETNLLLQMLGIMSDIENSSLVIIDEPETSSHPSWQINYVSWLQKIFKKFGNCHFLIASHSHFLLTDLQPECSNIIALTKENDGNIRDIANGVNAYCWSVDDILYRVFKVRNTRNFYFEKKFFRLFDLLENSEGKEQEIKNLYNELKLYRLNDDDPYNILLKEAENVKFE